MTAERQYSDLEFAHLAKQHWEKNPDYYTDESEKVSRSLVELLEGFIDVKGNINPKFVKDGVADIEAVKRIDPDSDLLNKIESYKQDLFEWAQEEKIEVSADTLTDEPKKVGIEAFDLAHSNGVRLVREIEGYMSKITDEQGIKEFIGFLARSNTESYTGEMKNENLLGHAITDLDQLQSKDENISDKRKKLNNTLKTIQFYEFLGKLLHLISQDINDHHVSDAMKMLKEISMKQKTDNDGKANYNKNYIFSGGVEYLITKAPDYLKEYIQNYVRSNNGSDRLGITLNLDDINQFFNNIFEKPKNLHNADVLNLAFSRIDMFTYGNDINFYKNLDTVFEVNGIEIKLQEASRTIHENISNYREYFDSDLKGNIRLRRLYQKKATIIRNDRYSILVNINKLIIRFFKEIKKSDIGTQSNILTSDAGFYAILRQQKHMLNEYKRVTGKEIPMYEDELKVMMYSGEISNS